MCKQRSVDNDEENNILIIDHHHHPLRHPMERDYAAGDYTNTWEYRHRPPPVEYSDFFMR